MHMHVNVSFCGTICYDVTWTFVCKI